jgi:uncharacterized protein
VNCYRLTFRSILSEKISKAPEGAKGNNSSLNCKRADVGLGCLLSRIPQGAFFLLAIAFSIIFYYAIYNSTVMYKIYKPLWLFLIILISWGLYRYFFHYPEWIDEFVAKPLIYLIPTLILLASEKKSFSSLGFSRKNFSRNVIIGLLAGLFLVGESLITKRLKYGFLTFNPDNLSLYLLFGNYFISLATGFTEEVVFRGYIQTRLTIVFNSAYFAIVLSSILFTVVHLPLIIFVLKYSLFETLTYCFLIFILGILNGILFNQTKSLTTPIITHSIWNYSSILFK